MTMPTPVRADDGFTLIELLIATAISVMAMGAVTTAFIVGLSTSETTTTKLAASNDAQMLASYLPSDMLSVSRTGVDTGAATATGCNDTVVSTEDGAKTRNWLRLQWSQDVGGVVTKYVASYRTRFSTDSWQLVRYFCSGTEPTTVAPEAIVVAHGLAEPGAPPPPPASTAAPLVTCSLAGVSTACGSGVDDVEIMLTTSSGYAFTVSGSRRTPDPVAVVVPPAVVPDHFVVSAPANATAGTSFDVTVTAVDAGGATLTGYRGTVQFTSSDATATLPPNTVFTAANNGVRTFTGLVLKKAGSRVVTVKDTTTTTATGTATVVVAAGPPTKLTWTNVSCASGTVDVGNGTFVSKVGLLDAYDNAAPNSTGAAVAIALTRTGPSGGTLTPLTLTIASSASETGGPVESDPSNGNKTDTVTATAAGQTWTVLTCAVKS